MNKKNNKKGFTLMEMLIVVAIIGILVAIAIPTFNNSLNKARVAADEANLRAYYAEVMASYLLDEDDVPEDVTTAIQTVKISNKDYTLYGEYTAKWNATDGNYVITYNGPTGSNVTGVEIPGNN